MIKIKTNCLVMAELRIKKGMLGTDLAKAVGVTRQAIYALEKGTMHPTPDLAKRITNALEVNFDNIFSLVEGD